jgi:hypothetical protein
VNDYQLTQLPLDDLWRVGWQSNPTRFRTPGPPGIPVPSSRGRFDDLLGHVATTYLAWTPQGAFTETALQHVAKPGLDSLLPDDDSIGPNTLSARFRTDRLLVNVALTATVERPTLDVVDLQHSETLAALDSNQRELFSRLGVPRLTLAEIHGGDRVVTNAVASALMHAEDEDGNYRYAGARFTSKYGSNHDCVVVFAGVNVSLKSASPIEADNEDLKAVAREFGLTVH